MEKSVLIVSEGSVPFLLASMKTKFTECGWSCEEASLKFRDIEKRTGFPGLIIGQAEDFNAHPDTLVYLADQCIQSGAKLVALGNPQDLNEFSASVSPTIVIATFTRPIDVNVAVQKITEAYERLAENLNRKKILVVDDSPVFLRTMMEWLVSSYQVNAVPSAAAAFNIINKNAPDLILLDYEMPVCSGAQFLQMLRSEESLASIPVIFLTSRDDAQAVKDVVHLKPQGYLLKTQPKDKIMKFIEDFFLKKTLEN